MDIVEQLKTIIVNAFKDIKQITNDDVVIEKTKDKNHGDYASNIALKFAKSLSLNPRELANKIISNISDPVINKIEIAGPGFINFFINEDSLQDVITTILRLNDNYGRGVDKQKRINVEFVSANPTGDLHVGTARGAAIGDSLARILSFYGYDVDKEYYINDAGNQITNLALSIQARILELLNKPFAIPSDGYNGQDIIEIAKKIMNEYSNTINDVVNDIELLKQIGIKYEMDKIRDDLALFNVSFDVFSSEKVIRSNNSIEKELDFLKPNTYEEEGATILKTSQYLDDKDRVIVKSNGEYTYFLPDIVYHLNKLSRGYDRLIDVLGADHHGYINRMKSALMMHGYDKDILDIELIQIVRFVKDGEEFKASKREGNAYKIRELVHDVGVDAARYFFAMRASSSHLDFDLSLAVEQNSNNPVYYVQYAYARMNSVLKLAGEFTPLKECTLLVTDKEKILLKSLANFPKVVSDAANELAPNKITNYLHELAENVHSWYNDTKILDKTNPILSANRLTLALAIKQIIKNGLGLIGVSAPEHM